MSGIKPSICKFYNRKTFITEILNLTTNPTAPHSHKVIQGEGTKRDKGEKMGSSGGKKREIAKYREEVKDYLFFSPRLFWSGWFILPRSEIKSEIIRLFNNVFCSYLVSEQRKNTWQKKDKKTERGYKNSKNRHTKWLRLFVVTFYLSMIMYKSYFSVYCRDSPHVNVICLV